MHVLKLRSNRKRVGESDNYYYESDAVGFLIILFIKYFKSSQFKGAIRKKDSATSRKREQLSALLICLLGVMFLI